MTLDRAVWESLGATGPGALESDRIVLHNAVQILASFGQALCAARSDDSHRSLTWRDGERSFATEPDEQGLYSAVRVTDLRLELRRGEERLAFLELPGHTLEESKSWLEDAVNVARDAPPVTLRWPEYHVPEMPQGRGTPISAAPAVLVELARWYHAAFLALTPIELATSEASPLRCWPHHFDLATLMTFPGRDAGEQRHVGAGLSPGDDQYAQPYLYVNGWPPPDPVALPAFEGPGRWHSDGWVGAVLTGDEVVASEPATQAGLVHTFLERALSAMKRAVDRED